MIKSVMRSIIVMAARTPSIVMRKIQNGTAPCRGVKEVQKRRERDNEQHRL